MKKYQIIILVAFGTITTLWIVGRFTKMFEYYSVPTYSNEPTIKNGSHLLASNLKTPKRLDFISYRSTVPEYENQIWIHRVCGLPGDTILIKDGDLFVNGIYQDKDLNLKKRYIVHRDLVAPLTLGEYDVLPKSDSDSVDATLETITHKDLIKQGRRYIEEMEDPLIKKLYGQPWNLSNFGPYVVPANTYFVLGDNRFATMDSRFSGPVKKENYLTTILFK
jgi:signal peptidase I